jgi:uncharacterized LabA/DUF88 family protein
MGHTQEASGSNVTSTANILFLDMENVHTKAFTAYQRMQKTIGVDACYAFGAANIIKLYSQRLDAIGAHKHITPVGKNAADHAIIQKIQELSDQTARPICIGIASGDADFVPTVKALKSRHIQTICYGNAATTSQKSRQHYDTCVLM